MADDIEIIDSETFTGEGDKEFSHQALVMRAMNKCLEAGSKEMRAGFVNEKRDKFGNIISTYIEDSRLTFIECVETLQMIMERDLDEVVEGKIKEINDKLNEGKTKLLKEEKSNFENAEHKLKQFRNTHNIHHRDGRFHTSLYYIQDYIHDQVTASRKIVGELNKLAKRLNDYTDEGIEN